ncbi:hypothetical protein MG293_018699 [Ovis ammon polii]|uniref:Uncharacterized protein n=1 Tax=Ovis ammon polii TaxID=230172 RepID=A0AAD4TPH2_OVIAM|nr:hypothetical protein MG293_018699 [Ovis ammon polii]
MVEDRWLCCVSSLTLPSSPQMGLKAPLAVLPARRAGRSVMTQARRALTSDGVLARDRSGGLSSGNRRNSGDCRDDGGDDDDGGGGAGAVRKGEG